MELERNGFVTLLFLDEILDPIKKRDSQTKMIKAKSKAFTRFDMTHSNCDILPFS
uniref:AlNc14C207G8831 protein n=1 Tax=Albugo laibachii Nc14 TaxID=890382 RepID=F0WR23_9STRA|nr:AlNc14C207G8831 [Albugo laibachii Nc14]|eukprot:CCA23783.1 AlNc14C207G8831 [Albugo laibachii Nc14]